MGKKTKKPKRKSLAKIRAEQIAEATDYAVQGHSYEDIAAHMKIEPETAKELVECGLERIVRHNERADLRLRIYRINQMVNSQYAAAAGGDREAIALVDRLEKERVELERELSPKYNGFFGIIRDFPASGTAGQPPHARTAETISIVLAMACESVPNERIAHYLGISAETLDVHYRTIIDGAKEKCNAEAVSGLRTHIIKQNQDGTIGAPWALAFRLKTQAQWAEARPPSTAAIEDTGAAPAQPGTEIIIRGGLPDVPDGSNKTNSLDIIQDDLTKGGQDGSA